VSGKTETRREWLGAKESVLHDFKQLKEEGVTHPDMEKIQALLTTETEAR
jgi:hypothetical protein